MKNKELGVTDTLTEMVDMTNDVINKTTAISNSINKKHDAIIDDIETMSRNFENIVQLFKEMIDKEHNKKEKE